MLVVGLTGGIGSGKSTVAGLFARRGAVVVDADAISRQVVEPGGPAYEGVVARFGPGVLQADGRLDRAAVAAIVFRDDDARKDLNGLTHPFIGAEVLRRVGEAPQDAVVVLDVPLIVEAGARTYDVVVVVEAPLDVRLDRLEGRGVERADAERRIGVQATDAQRRSLADYVIDNADGIVALESAVDGVWAELVRRRIEKDGADASGGERAGSPG